MNLSKDKFPGKFRSKYLGLIIVGISAVFCVVLFVLGGGFSPYMNLVTFVCGMMIPVLSSLSSAVSTKAGGPDLAFPYMAAFGSTLYTLMPNPVMGIIAAVFLCGIFGGLQGMVIRGFRFPTWATLVFTWVIGLGMNLLGQFIGGSRVKLAELFVNPRNGIYLASVLVIAMLLSFGIVSCTKLREPVQFCIVRREYSKQTIIGYGISGVLAGITGVYYALRLGANSLGYPVVSLGIIILVWLVLSSSDILGGRWAWIAGIAVGVMYHLADTGFMLLGINQHISKFLFIVFVVIVFIPAFLRWRGKF